METSVKTRLSQMLKNFKESLKEHQIQKAEQQKRKVLTRELISIVKNPDENAAQKIADLAKQGADVNTFDMDKERSLLHFAAEQNRMDVVKALVENGCKTYININDIYGKDPAFYAIDNNNPQMLDYLLSNGVSTNRPADFNLESSFRYAVRSGRIELAEIELKHGADINDHVDEEFLLYGKHRKTYPGPTPLADVVGGQEINDGSGQAKKYDMAMVEFLLQNGARTDLKDVYGQDLRHIENIPQIRQIMLNRTSPKTVSPASIMKAKSKTLV